MTEEDVNRYLLLLAQLPTHDPPHCVILLVPEDPIKKPFPPLDSSSLCAAHVETVRTSWRRPISHELPI